MCLIIFEEKAEIQVQKADDPESGSKITKRSLKSYAHFLTCLLGVVKLTSVSAVSGMELDPI